MSSILLLAAGIIIVFVGLAVFTHLIIARIIKSRRTPLEKIEKMGENEIKANMDMIKLLQHAMLVFYFALALFFIETGALNKFIDPFYGASFMMIIIATSGIYAGLRDQYIEFGKGLDKK